MFSDSFHTLVKLWIVNISLSYQSQPLLKFQLIFMPILVAYPVYANAYKARVSISAQISFCPHQTIDGTWGPPRPHGITLHSVSLSLVRRGNDENQLRSANNGQLLLFF